MITTTITTITIINIIINIIITIITTTTIDDSRDTSVILWRALVQQQLKSHKIV